MQQPFYSRPRFLPCLFQYDKAYLLRLVESFLKDEYKLDWIDLDIKVNDANGHMNDVGRLYHDEKNELCSEESE